MGFFDIIKLQWKASSSSSILASGWVLGKHGKFHKSSITWGYFEAKKHKKKSRPKSALRCYKALCYLGFAYALKYLLSSPSSALPCRASSLHFEDCGWSKRLTEPSRVLLYFVIGFPISSLPSYIFCLLDKSILLGLAQIHKIRIPTANTHLESSIPLRVFLRLFKNLGIKYVSM